MTKKALGLAFVIAAAIGAGDRGAAALPNNGGGPGGNYDCSICWHTGGWIPGSLSFATCESTPNGGGGGCVARGNTCMFSGGCVSLPDGIWPVAVAP